MTMRFAILNITLLYTPLFACPNIEQAATAYIAENFAADEEESVQVRQQVKRINTRVIALQLSVPPDKDTEGSKPGNFVAFFSGSTHCEFAQQWDGEIAEVVESGRTKYILIRTESNDGEENSSHFQFVTVTPEGTVGNTRDQHGTEIDFSEATQNRCDGKIGQRTSWSRDANDALLLIVRERRTDRDEKCRLIEDASTFRYYRLAADHWHLDDGAHEQTEPTKPTR